MRYARGACNPKPIQGRLKNPLQSFSDDLYSSRRQAYNHGLGPLYGFNTVQIRGLRSSEKIDRLAAKPIISRFPTIL
ncbi:hypothetical protein NEISICOT_03086 [Neisseria sicca ATCC 29256]|uniref:Uncharacterized protein n=1 Tax=Neisseria sicca ATCC 29256 TaxID=547045 RepID=C6M961_NEISI|nr:hypothetical protein NEISICOT_03086 [Neisseria sicca ATCC 29256]